MFFIHTFSLKKLFDTVNEASSLWNYYTKDIIKNKNHITLNHFASKGVRLKMRYLNIETVHFKKKEVELEIIITPYKLLHNNEAIGRLTTTKDYILALKEYYNIVSEIKANTGIDISDATTYRIDVTKDVVTPSSDYTNEIISVLKTTNLPYGYDSLSETDYLNRDWNPDNSYNYSNTKQGISVQIYNKIKQLDEYTNTNTDFIGTKGLLRFELSLSKHTLKKRNLYDNNILDTITNTLNNAAELFIDYIICPINLNEMLSTDVLIRYINRKITQPKKKDKMIQCIYKCLDYKNARIYLDNTFLATEKRTRKTLEYFDELNLSPVSLIPTCPFIPSVYDMLFDEGSNKYNKLLYCKKHTRGKEYWQYEDYNNKYSKR